MHAETYCTDELLIQTKTIGQSDLDY